MFGNCQEITNPKVFSYPKFLFSGTPKETESNISTHFLKTNAWENIQGKWSNFEISKSKMQYWSDATKGAQVSKSLTQGLQRNLDTFTYLQQSIHPIRTNPFGQFLNKRKCPSYRFRLLVNVTNDVAKTLLSLKVIMVIMVIISF